ncbi:MAG: ferritin family protein [Candidatus Cloacimonetes bacterium]|nr:ferritin family protein [Candidatus Cloacimonadota bacterium]
MTKQESYRIVIEAEIRAQMLYEALAKSFTNNDTRSVFHELIILEKGHEEKVRAAFKQEFPGEDFKLMGNLKLDLQDVNLNDPKDVLEYAIGKEDLANGIYLGMAEKESDAEIKAMMLKFAKEENDHKALLLAEVQRIQGAMQWYDPSELNGMMED